MVGKKPHRHLRLMWYELHVSINYELAEAI